MKAMQNIGESIVETHVHDTPVVHRIRVPTIDVDELRNLLSESLTLDNPSHLIPKPESPKTLCTKVNKTPLQDISNYNTTLFPKIPFITLGNSNNKVVSLTRTSIIDPETLENSNSLNKFDHNFDLNYSKATYSPSLRITSSPALSQTIGIKRYLDVGSIKQKKMKQNILEFYSIITKETQSIEESQSIEDTSLTMLTRTTMDSSYPK